jgi:hypothetical protein
MIGLEELDVQIAEKVMGCIHEERGTCFKHKAYSTDIAAAMEVVAKILEEKYWMFDMRSSSPGVGMVWFCETIGPEPGQDARFSTLAELPRAICEAALKTVRVKQ